MNIEIREITETDYPEVVLLWNNELGNHHVNEENLASVMVKMNQEGNYKTFVALSENNVVGFIATSETLAAGFDVGYLMINGLAVKTNSQNKKIGTKLLEYVVEYAVEKGFSSIILNSGFKRKEAHAFYENNGFEKTSYCFVKEL